VKPIDYFWATRGTDCEMCHIRPATQRHHCLYHRKKGVKELDEEYNIMIVCEKCHLYDGTPNSHETKVAFWNTQCARYGKERMLAWHRRVSLKVKEHAYK